MRKLFMVAIGMLVAALFAGCGGGSGGSSGTRISAITTVAITDADVAGKTFYIKNSDGTLDTFDAPATANGNIVLTSGTFVCIQKETASSYWLVYNSATFAISRLYFDQAAAIAYDPQLMGGAIQGNSKLLTSSTSQVALYAGNPTVTGESEGDVLTSATFDQPRGITTDREYNYVLDFTNGRIRQISKSGDTVTTWTLKDSSGSTVTLDEPAGITNYGDYLYVADTGNHVIRRVSKTESVGGSHLTTVFAGNSDETAGSVDDSTGSDAYFNTPIGITTDGTNLYVVDSGNGTIRKIVISTTAVSTLAGKNGEIGDDDGVYTDARFYTPWHLTTDGTYLYIIDTGNRTVRKLQIATGTVTTLAGDSDPETLEHKDGVGKSANFYKPFGITTDGVYLYVTDCSDLTKDEYFDNRIRRIEISSAIVTTIAGGQAADKYSEEPNPLESGVSVTGEEARFAQPRGIVWDGSLSRLYVTNGSYALKETKYSVKVGDSTWNCIFRITAAP